MTTPTVCIVDDAVGARGLLKAAFRDDCHTQTYMSGEECLAAMDNPEVELPSLFLLDVDMPGMDGYALCKALRAQPRLASIPVIFISGMDDLDSRLQGYDAGGIDYVIKPYHIAELRLKVKSALALNEDQQALSVKLEEAEQLTTAVMSDLDEYAIMVSFFRTLNQCVTPRDLAMHLLAATDAYHLQAVTQIRTKTACLTRSASSENNPLEISVIEHVRHMDRIMEFKNRAAFNFDGVTLLINDMPRQDPDRCGRLRDKLAIMVETVNDKLQSIVTKADLLTVSENALQVFDSLHQTVELFGSQYAGARYKGSELIRQTTQELTKTFASMELSDSQESRLHEFFQHKAEELADIYDFGASIKKTLEDLSTKVEALVVR